uniref:BTB domain-containing protein n=1 Tax=Oryza meridionalis TaxID=40149 RepID=A0A0E0DCJ2_9ORYZ
MRRRRWRLSMASSSTVAAVVFCCSHVPPPHHHCTRYSSIFTQPLFLHECATLPPARIRPHGRGVPRRHTTTASLAAPFRAAAAPPSRPPLLLHDCAVPRAALRHVTGCPHQATHPPRVPVPASSFVSGGGESSQNGSIRGCSGCTAAVLRAPCSALDPPPISSSRRRRRGGTRPSAGAHHRNRKSEARRDPEPAPLAAMQPPVLLNIGGSRYETTADTLTQRDPGSLLAAVLSGAAAHGLPTTEDGAVFVDRDGELFRHVLNWLRDGAVPALADAEYRQLLREAEYYRLPGLIDCINERIGDWDDKIGRSSEAELTRKDVIKCIQADKVRFRGVNLSGLDLSKLDLSEVDFSCGCIEETKCEFVGANLQESTLDRANLQSANLQDACLVKCSFIETDLRSAHLQSADLTGANLTGANLEGANLKGAKLSGSNLQGANLQRAYLREVDLRETQLTGAKLGGANLLGAIRYDCVCTYVTRFVSLVLGRFVGERDEPEQDDGDHDVEDHLPVPAQRPGELLSAAPRRRAAAGAAGDLSLLLLLLLAVAAGGGGGGGGGSARAGHLDVEDALVELDLDRRRVAGGAGREVEPLEEVEPMPAAAVDGALAADPEAPRRLHLDLEMVLAEPCNNLAYITSVVVAKIVEKNICLPVSYDECYRNF